MSCVGAIRPLHACIPSFWDPHLAQRFTVFWVELMLLHIVGQTGQWPTDLQGTPTQRNSIQARMHPCMHACSSFQGLLPLHEWPLHAFLCMHAWPRLHGPLTSHRRPAGA